MSDVILTRYCQAFGPYEEIRGRRVELRSRLKPDEALRESYTQD